MRFILASFLATQRCKYHIKLSLCYMTLMTRSASDPLIDSTSAAASSFRNAPLVIIDEMTMTNSYRTI